LKFLFYCFTWLILHLQIMVNNILIFRFSIEQSNSLTSKHYIERWIYWNFVLRVRFFIWKYYAMHSEISEICGFYWFFKEIFIYVGLHCRIKEIGYRFLYKAIISSKTGTLFCNILKIKFIQFNRIESLFNESSIFMQILTDAVHSKKFFLQYKNSFNIFLGNVFHMFQHSYMTWPRAQPWNLAIIV